MAFVIDEDYVFINEYPEDDDSNDESDNEYIPKKNKKIIDVLIQETVSKFFSNKNYNNIIIYNHHFTNIIVKN
jgi:hypothetical protein